MKCEHKNTEYQPAEPEINVHEDVFCIDCGKSVIEEFDCTFRFNYMTLAGEGGALGAG